MSLVIVDVLAEPLHKSNLAFGVLFLYSRLLLAGLFRGNVAVDELSHAAGHFFLPGEPLEQPVPLRDQIFIVEGGYLRADLGDDFGEEADRIAVLAEDGVVPRPCHF